MHADRGDLAGRGLHAPPIDLSTTYPLRHVVAVRPLYGCSDHLLTAGLLGTEVTWIDPAGVADALRPDTGLVLV